MSNKMSIRDFKIRLARVFDDKLHTRQWGNVVDYIIIGFILLSSIEIFLATFEGVVERYGRWLNLIDIITTIFFTVEVSLRIWCADLLDSRYKGFWGRIRYCFSFYGLIDVLATYPFYLHFFFPFSYTALKTLRIMRLLRIFRFMRSFRLLRNAVNSKRSEMFVSLQFLCIVTIILSFILYFLEHEAQPTVYKNGIDSVVWAFAQYIGDPGGFADNPPITFWGRIIACIVGILGIAIFAVPAGLIGAGFTEALEEEVHAETSKKNAAKIYSTFERKLDRYSHYQIVPKFQSIVDIQYQMGLKPDDILDGVAAADNLRLINLASTRPLEEKAEDKLAVECFIKNRPYGCCIDRGSKVTIVAPTAFAEATMGAFAFYIAKFGGFNFISKEVGTIRPYKSFYLLSGEQMEGLDDYMADLQKLASTKDHWLITIMAASGANEPALPTQFHFGFGGKKGDESFNADDLLVNDVRKAQQLYHDFAHKIEAAYQLLSDCQRYHDSTNPKIYVRHLDVRPNAIIIRVAWSVACWDTHSFCIARLMAEVFNEHLEADKNKELPADLKVKDIGYDNYLL